MGHPANSPLTMVRAMATTVLEKRGFNSPCHTVAPAGVIVDLDNEPEDSEYEDP